MGFRVVALDHVQLAMPPGAEAVAEAFYCGVLGFHVLPKPEPLASREAGGSCSAVYRSIWVWKRTSALPAKHIQPWWWTTSTCSWLAWTPRGVERRPDNDLPGARGGAHIDHPVREPGRTDSPA